MSSWKLPAHLVLSFCAVLLSHGCTSSGSPILPGLRAAPPAAAGAGTGTLARADASMQSPSLTSGMPGNALGVLGQNSSAGGSAAISGAGGTAGAVDGGGMGGASAAAGSSAGAAGHASDAGVAGSGGGHAASMLDAAADSGGANGGDAGMCENLVCLSIFDCLFYHPAQYLPCKITRCDNFVCKP
jgi:hypothetical protein